MLGMLDRSVLIAMPTKCGTERLKSTLVRRLKVAEELPEDHGWRRYENLGFRERWLLVRDPLDRWVSTYWWLKSTEKNQGFSKIVGKSLDRFHTFAELVATQPSQAFVFQPLWHYLDQFNPTKIVKLEHMIPEWHRFFDEGWKEEYMKATPHATRYRESVEKTIGNRKKLPMSFINYISTDYLRLVIYYHQPKYVW